MTGMLMKYIISIVSGHNIKYTKIEQLINIII